MRSRGSPRAGRLASAAAAAALGLLLLQSIPSLAPPLHVSACTTLAVARRASLDGSVFAAHSNDWASDPSPGALSLVPAARHPEGSVRSVSHGAIPQAARTFRYLTGGYGAANEYGLGVAESTCRNRPWPREAENAGALDIVDLSRIVLERARTAREGVGLMGALAERHGYRDAAESLLVVDPGEAYIFHVLRSPAPVGAVWAAQRVPDGHVAVVANAFTIREIDFDAPEDFLYSENMVALAEEAGFYAPPSPFDFTRVFGGGAGPQYASGRRMWRAYSLLAPGVNLNATYEDYIRDAPYPATIPASNVSKSLLFQTMRDFYANTPYALDKGMAAGFAGNPTRWSPGEGEKEVQGAWERPISLYRSQISFVLQLPREGPTPFVHYSPNAAHSGTYVPLSPRMSRLPPCVTNTTQWSKVERWSLAWATRYIFNLMQMNWSRMYNAFSSARLDFEDDTDRILRDLPLNATSELLDDELGARSEQAVDWLWGLSDALMAKFANNGGGPEGYPAWWLSSPEVGYTEGPHNADRKAKFTKH